MEIWSCAGILIRNVSMTKLGNILQTNRIAKLAEILILFVLCISIIFIGWRFAGGNLLARQLVVLFANLIMIAYVWIGLSVRGQTWDHFGLSLRFKGWMALVRIILMSIVVFVVSALAFMVVSVFIQTSSDADMSGYDYLKGNLPMFFAANWPQLGPKGIEFSSKHYLGDLLKDEDLEISV